MLIDLVRSRENHTKEFRLDGNVGSSLFSFSYFSNSSAKFTTHLMEGAKMFSFNFIYVRNLRTIIGGKMYYEQKENYQK